MEDESDRYDVPLSLAYPSEDTNTKRDTVVERLNIPLLCVIWRVLLFTVDDLPLSGQWALYKGTLLLVEVAQDTQHSALVYHTATLPSPAGVTGSFPP